MGMFFLCIRLHPVVSGIASSGRPSVRPIPENASELTNNVFILNMVPSDRIEGMS